MISTGKIVPSARIWRDSNMRISSSAQPDQKDKKPASSQGPACRGVGIDDVLCREIGGLWFLNNRRYQVSCRDGGFSSGFSFNSGYDGFIFLSCLLTKREYGFFVQCPDYTRLPADVKKYGLGQPGQDLWGDFDLQSPSTGADENRIKNFGRDIHDRGRLFFLAQGADPA